MITCVWWCLYKNTFFINDSSFVYLNYKYSDVFLYFLSKSNFSKFQPLFREMLCGIISTGILVRRLQWLYSVHCKVLLLSDQQQWSFSYLPGLLLHLEWQRCLTWQPCSSEDEPLSCSVKAQTNESGVSELLLRSFLRAGNHRPNCWRVGWTCSVPTVWMVLCAGLKAAWWIFGKINDWKNIWKTRDQIIGTFEALVSF